MCCQNDAYLRVYCCEVYRRDRFWFPHANFRPGADLGLCSGGWCRATAVGGSTQSETPYDHISKNKRVLLLLPTLLYLPVHVQSLRSLV